MSSLRHAFSTVTAPLGRLQLRTVLTDPVLLAGALTAALTILFLVELVAGRRAAALTAGAAALLWLTVAIAAVAVVAGSGRGRRRPRHGQADASARRLPASPVGTGTDGLGAHAAWEWVPAATLRPGMLILVEAEDVVPADGEVVDGAAEVDESRITGESAPVIRETSGDQSTLLAAGTRVLSDRLVVRVTAAPGDTFLDHIAGFIDESAGLSSRRETRLGLALVGAALLAAVVATAAAPAVADNRIVTLVVALALFGALLRIGLAVGILAVRWAGLRRLLEANFVCRSAAAVEAAGRITTVLLDKTGTITSGERQARAFLPLPGVSE